MQILQIFHFESARNLFQQNFYHLYRWLYETQLLMFQSDASALTTNMNTHELIFNKNAMFASLHPR